MPGLRGDVAWWLAGVAVLLAICDVSARPGLNSAVIKEQLKISEWCDLHENKGGWFQTEFDLARCKHVNGTGHRLTDDDATALAAALQKASEVSVLTLSASGLSSAGAQALLGAVSTHGTLGGLILDNNDIDSEAASSIARLLEENKKLAVLDLSHNKLKTQDILNILLGLEMNTALVVLSLDGNDLMREPEETVPGDEGGLARGFSGLLHERTALRVLRVGRTGINAAGVHLIMDALESNDHLEEFEISFDGIGHLGAEMIADAIQLNKVLRRLTIDGSGITDDGAAEIAHALKSNEALQELSIMSNSLTGAAAKSFAEVLVKDSNTLVELNLGYRDHGMSPEWWHFIQSLLQCNANNNQANSGDCKELVVEREEERVCEILSQHELDCTLFYRNEITTLGDIMDLSVDRCAKLTNNAAACAEMKRDAAKNERPFTKDFSDL